MFKKVQENVQENVQEGSRRFKKVQECSRECSRRFKKVQEGSRMFNRCENDRFFAIYPNINATASITGTVRDVRNGVDHNSLSDDIHAVRLVIVLFV